MRRWAAIDHAGLPSFPIEGFYYDSPPHRHCSAGRQDGKLHARRVG